LMNGLMRQRKEVDRWSLLRYKYSIIPWIDQQGRSCERVEASLEFMTEQGGIKELRIENCS